MKARQRLNFMRVLRLNNMERRLLVAFCRATTVNSATSTVVVLRLYGESSGGLLLEFIVTARCLSKAGNIRDFYHPGHHLLEPLVGVTDQ